MAALSELWEPLKSPRSVLMKYVEHADHTIKLLIRWMAIAIPSGNRAQLNSDAMLLM